MPMRIFFSAGEPSGDLHGANLIQTIRQRYPDAECVGFGGERMEAAGCQILYPLSQLAVMGFVRIFSHLASFVQLVSWTDRYFKRRRPDAVVLIDFPGFNWWMARRAHFRGIPVFYFVPPQLWGWAGWRVRKMQRWVDHVLCTLPFEESWYAERGVAAHYVGHPYFDELPYQQLDTRFLASQRARQGSVIGLLPGSRTQEVETNLPTLVGAAKRIHDVRPDVRFLVACYKESQYEYVQRYLRSQAVSFIEPYLRCTPEIIELSHACVAVSGSVGLELLYRAKPTVVVYGVSRWEMHLVRRFRTSKFISLVNLLADHELFPEFLTDQCVIDDVAKHMLRWLDDPTTYSALRAELLSLRGRVAEPGACARAAEFILEQLETGQTGVSRAA